MKTRKIIIVVSSILIALLFSCTQKKPSDLIVAKWYGHPFEGNKWDIQFFKDGTTNANYADDRGNYDHNLKGTYQFINDDKSLSLSFTLDLLYYHIHNTKSMSVEILKLDKDSLIVKSDEGKIYFSKIERELKETK